MIMEKNNKIYWIYIGIIFLFLCLLTLLTNYYGSTDIASFASPAKYFAGDYQAKIRSSHSYLWGFINFPLVKLFNNLIGFKILNLIILGILIYSIYYISKKDKRALFLTLLSPIIWYMAPWINSIQIASLFFLWNYYFIEKYNKTNKIKYLFYSGIFLGLSISFWHAIFFLGAFYLIIFLYNKPLSHFFYYILFILSGLIPLMALDFYLFGFPFHSLIKNISGTILNNLGFGVYSDIRAIPKTLSVLLSFLLIIPVYFWVLLKKENFKKNKKIIIFLIGTILILLHNPQIRYLLLLVPIMILILIKTLNKNQIKKLIIISTIISLIIIIPYEIQIKYPTTNLEEFTLLIKNFPSFNISLENKDTIINQDLIQISKEYPNEIFLVGNNPDDYHRLADIYWGDNIKEFISIQDYNLYLKNSSTLVERTIRFSPLRINGRREFWISGGIGKPINDNTEYDKIDYAISLQGNFSLSEFNLIKKYEILYLYERV